MWKNIVGRSRPQMTKWRMRIACWIPRAANTHSVCVIFTALPLQQSLQERPSNVTLYVHCLSFSFFEICL